MTAVQRKKWRRSGKYGYRVVAHVGAEEYRFMFYPDDTMKEIDSLWLGWQQEK